MGFPLKLKQHNLAVLTKCFGMCIFKQQLRCTHILFTSIIQSRRLAIAISQNITKAIENQVLQHVITNFYVNVEKTHFSLNSHIYEKTPKENQYKNREQQNKNHNHHQVVVFE